MPEPAARDEPDLPDGPGLSEGETLRRRLAELAGHIHAAQAEMVELLGRLDACGGWHGVGLRSIGHWASIELGLDARATSAHVRAARVLDDTPAIAASARAGELGWAKVELVTRVAEPSSEARWLDLAREMSVGQLRRVVSAYQRADRAENGPGDDPARRRGLWLFDEPNGLVRVSGLLTPDDAAVLRAALNAQLERQWRAETAGSDAAASEPAGGAPPTASGADPTADGGSAPVGQSSDVDDPGEPPRPAELEPARAADSPIAARRVDAFVDLLRSALDVPDRPDPADDSTQVIVHVDLAFLTGEAPTGRCHTNHGDPLPRETARRAACDALIRPLLHDGDGRPLDLGRSTRTVNRAQRRALARRDNGCCTFPGCTTTIGLAAHHLTYWTDGGPTDLDNLALLCRFHHRLHHEGGYVVQIVDGRLRFFRPDGSPIGPPEPPQPDAQRGLVTLRAQHDDAGLTVTHRTPGARSGGAPYWSPGLVLDARFR